MQHRIVSLGVPFVVGIIGLALGWFAHAAVPLSAQGIVVDGRATLSDPAAPAAPAGTFSFLTYQGRLTNGSGTPINSPVNATFVLYDSANSPIYTATRTISPANGLFTVYLGDGADPDLSPFMLGATASIGVTVGGDTEMTPRQALNSVVGHSNSGPGVVGSSTSDFGVIGYSTGYTAIFGSSTSGVGVLGNSKSEDGVHGHTSSLFRAGVRAFGAGPSGTALQLADGGIKVDGASGIDSNTFAFVHESTAGNTFGSNTTVIDNALTNGDPNAMLFITRVYNPVGVTGSFLTTTVGAYYDGTKWNIYTEDGSTMPISKAFNVMVIKR